MNPGTFTASYSCLDTERKFLLIIQCRLLHDKDEEKILIKLPRDKTGSNRYVKKEQLFNFTCLSVNNIQVMDNLVDFGSKVRRWHSVVATLMYCKFKENDHL